MSSRILAIALVFVLGEIATADVRYRVRAIRRLSAGTDISDPRDINARGLVVGLDDDGWSIYWPYRWDPQSNQIQNLGSLPDCGPGASLEAINDLGHAAGTDAGQDCESEAILWTPEGGMIGIGDLPGGNFWSQALDINNLDQIVGRSHTGSTSEAFLWTPGEGMQALGTLYGGSTSWAGGVNDSSWVVGESGTDAFLWRPGIGMMPLGGPDGVAGPPVYGRANDINELGQVTGDAYFEGGLQPYLWDPVRGAIPAGRFYDDPTGFGVGLAINNLGVIVGYELVGPGQTFPIIWDETRGLRDLRTLTDPCYEQSFPPLMLSATGINDDGWIIIERAGIGALLRPYIPGDLDEDADCDLQDLAYQLANFGRTGDADYAAGDLDCDQDVDLEDLTILLSNFGETLP